MRHTRELGSANTGGVTCGIIALTDLASGCDDCTADKDGNDDDNDDDDDDDDGNDDDSIVAMRDFMALLSVCFATRRSTTEVDTHDAFVGVVRDGQPGVRVLMAMVPIPS